MNIQKQIEELEQQLAELKIYRRFQRLYKLAEELNQGWEPDWTDGSLKCRLTYNPNTNEWAQLITRVDNPLIPVFKDEVVAAKALQLIEQGALE